MTDKELIRRALLGDHEAQQECTDKGIVLPCPFCGNKNIRISNWGMWRCWCPECLGKSEDSLRERDAIKHWNTRPVPPIGRCRDCLRYLPISKRCKYSLGGLWGEVNELSFCSCFKPRED